ncbi:SRPBCC family protein [Rhodococcus sp. NPDC060086]|uniref:SRPBCC family protein n=1 Tax=Rhodococcus sp. NPDC060086 TaxID=3347055 RepID=UPI0036596BC0
MSRIARQDTTASPSEVWNVFSDGWRYVGWVVGASRIRQVDATWPDVGSRIHHSVGLWPALLDDYTEVLARTAERELVLAARAWPFGRAEIRLTVVPSETGSHITMSEHVTGGVGRVLPGLVQTELVRPRNQECLRRLVLIAERGTHREAVE